MKHKLFFNKLWLRVGMIVAIMTTALAGTVKAETVTYTWNHKSKAFLIETATGDNVDNVTPSTTTTGTSQSNYQEKQAIQLMSNNGTTVRGTFSLTLNSFPYPVTGISFNYRTTSGKKSGSMTATLNGNAFASYSSNLSSNSAWSDIALNVTGISSGGENLIISAAYTTNSVYVHSITITYTTGSVTPTCATPTFSPAAGTYTSAQNVTISTTTTGATIYYTTDGTDPTTGSSVYSSAIPVSTTTTIKAIAVASGYDNSSVASATYTIVSLNHAGTEADPYTVADARAAIDANVGKTGVYATGVVSEIVDTYSSQYSNITFDIIDEGGSNTLRAYRCTGTEAANVQVGDVVVVSGNLTLYGTTYEFESGCTLVSRTSSSSQVAAGFSFSSNSAEADLADLSSFTAPIFNNPNNITVTFSSSNPAVATVAQDGTVTPLAKGTTTITATSEETSEYLAGEASYTLTVTNSNAALVTVDADGNTTFDFTDNAWGFPTSKQLDENSYSNNGYTVTIAGAGSGNGFYFYESGSDLLFGKNGAYLTLPAFDYDVEKIVVVGKAGASTSVEQNIYVGDEAVSTATTGATGTNTYMIAEAYKAAGNVYTLKVTSAHNSQVTSIKVYKAAPDNRTPVTLTFTGVPATIVKDETATYAVTASPAVTGITYSSSDGDVVMVDENTGEIGALALGTATITATFAGDDDYKPATASYEIEVVAPTHTVTFFVNGVEQTGDEAEVSEGAAITFPATPADVNGKTFVGWTTAAIEGTTDTAPTMVTSATMGTADVTYYAVFATSEGGGSTTATLTETEIKANFTDESHKYDAGEKTYDDTEDGIEWAASYNVDSSNRPWIQLKKDVTAYLKITATDDISEVKLTITSASNSSGGVADITKHTAFAGTVYLESAASSSPSGALGLSDEITNNVVTIVPTSTVQEVYVQVSSGARIWGVEVTYGSASYSGYCTTVVPATESVTVTDAGYATYCSENALDFTNTEIKAYVGTKNGDKLTFTPATQVPAGTGLLLVYEGSKTENVPVIASATAVENNCLVGVNEETTISSNDYILNKVNDGVGFYKAGDYTTLGAHKAYIPAAVGNGVKGFVINLEDDATGISLMEDGRSQMEDGVIYNLAGQRISKMQKGINIVNGKKIAVK